MSQRHDPGDERLRARVREALDRAYRPAPGLARRCAEAVARRRRRRGVPPVVAWTLLVAATTAAVVGILVQHAVDRGSRVPAATPAPAAHQLLYVLTAGNQVVALDRGTLRPRWRAQAAAAPSGAVTAGQFLAMSPDAASLYAVPPADEGGGRRLVLLDAASGRSLGSVVLSAAGGPLYRTLAVGPQSGLVYAVGEDAGHVVVTVVDPRRQVVLASQATQTLPATRPSGFSQPYQAAVDPGGGRLWYSVAGTGADGGGLDWADLSGAGLRPCHAAAGSACVPGSGGGFVLRGGGALLLDAAVPPQVVEVAGNGAVAGRLDTGLAGQSSDLLLDPAGTGLLVLGGCPGLGGLSGVDLGGGALRTVATPAPAGGEPGPETVCGQRPALLDSGHLAVSRLASGTASQQSPGTVDVVDLATGRISRSATLAAEATDLLAPG